jgi:hypothetical protein
VEVLRARLGWKYAFSLNRNRFMDVIDASTEDAPEILALQHLRAKPESKTDEKGDTAAYRPIRSSVPLSVMVGQQGVLGAQE